MEIALTWDFVFLVVLILLFAYNFLLGQSSTIKVIISIYIAILTADGVAGALYDYVFLNSPGLQKLFFESVDEIFTGIRITVFLAAIVTFVIRGGFHIHLKAHDHWAARTGIHGLFAILSAVLFTSTVLIYFSGHSFIEGITYAKDISLYNESWIAHSLIDHYQLWFSLPAISFLVTSFFFDPTKD